MAAETRRDFLKLAAGLGLSFALPGMGNRAAEQRGRERPRSLIALWMGGGASQLETWDPHPGSPIGGPTRAIKTALPGVQIAADYPLLAEQLHHLSLIRSLVSKEGDHARGTYLVKTGFPPDPAVRHPSLGSIVTHELPNPKLEIPPFVSLGYDQYPSLGGYLGGGCDAFRVFEPGPSAPNLKQAVDDPRQQRRVEDLDIVSQAFAQGRRVPAARTMHQQTAAAALKMMTSEQLRAFEIAHEPAAVRAAYGDSSFGRGCLVARRLVEQGVRAVEVTLQGFDSHENNFGWHEKNAAILDPAFTALLRDLQERDLFQSTVVLCLGEFGRTPKINRKEGRDHWPGGFSCLVGGGGLKSGVLIGATDPAGERKTPSDPVEVPDLCATVLGALGIDITRDHQTPVGRPMKFSGGKPIRRLLG